MAYWYEKRMKKLNSYIIEKLKINKESTIDIENEIVHLLKEFGDLELEDVFGNTITDKNGDEADMMWVVGDTIRYSLLDDPSDSIGLDDLSEMFTMDEIQELYNYLNEKVK